MKTMNPEKYQQWDANKGPDGPDTCPLALSNLDDDTCDTSYQGTNNAILTDAPHMGFMERRNKQEALTAQRQPIRMRGRF